VRAAPGGAVVLSLAAFAVAGSPPFGAFISEWLLLQATFAAGHFWAGGLVLAGLTLTFVALSNHVGRILFGVPPALAGKPLGSAWLLIPGALMLVSLLAGVAVSPRVLALLGMLTQGGVR
jgi:hydrogenase-4 component F